MNCQEERALVEKLADGEATSEERTRAEKHLESCETCRSHYAFLLSVAETRRRQPLTEPPEAYWSSMSRNILARIAEEETEGSRGQGPSRARALVSGTTMRFVGLAAGVLLAVAVVWNVTHPGTNVPSSSDVGAPAVASRRAAPSAPEEEAASAEPASPPAASAQRSQADSESRDELAEPVTTGGESEPKPQLAARSLEDAQASEFASAEGFSKARAQQAPRAAAARPPSPRVAQDRASDELATLGSASRLERASPEAEPEGTCEPLREALQRAGEGEEATDLSFQLARCELSRYEREPSEPTRARAIADAEAFLARESEGSRADEIRRALAGVPRDTVH
jgi:hypothetical protein